MDTEEVLQGMDSRQSHHSSEGSSSPLGDGPNPAPPRSIIPSDVPSTVAITVPNRPALPALTRPPRTVQELLARIQEFAEKTFQATSYALEVVSDGTVEEQNATDNSSTRAFFDLVTQRIYVDKDTMQSLAILVDYLAHTDAYDTSDPMHRTLIKELNEAVSVIFHEFIHSLGPKRAPLIERDWERYQDQFSAAIESLSEGTTQLAAYAYLPKLIRALRLPACDPLFSKAIPKPYVYIAQLYGVRELLRACAPLVGSSYDKELCIFVRLGGSTQAIEDLITRILKHEGLMELPFNEATLAFTQLRRALLPPFKLAADLDRQDLSRSLVESIMGSAVTKQMDTVRSLLTAKRELLVKLSSPETSPPGQELG